MKILIDGHGLLPGPKGAGGAGRYLLSLLGGLPRLGHPVRVIASLDNDGLYKGLRDVEVCVAARLDEWVLLPHFRWADVYYAPLNGLRPALIPHDLPVVACVHDLQHNYAPEFFSKAVWEARNEDYGFAIKRANRLIAISEFEKQNLTRFFGKTEIDVVHHGGYLADSYSTESAVHYLKQGAVPSGDYVIYPAVAWPHKNHLRLVQAFVLARRMGLKCKLVLTGALEHDLSRPDFLRAAQELGLTDQELAVKGFVPDTELAALLRYARAMVFPSLYEGFGIPVAEAMKLGTPVIATRATAIPEVAGDAALYFSDGENAITIARDLVRYLDDNALLREKSQLGLARGKQFSTEQMCRETSFVFERAIEGCAKQVSRSPARITAEAHARRSNSPLAVLRVVSADDLSQRSNSYDEVRTLLTPDVATPIAEMHFFLPLSASIDELSRAESAITSAGGKVCLYDDSVEHGLTEAIRFAHKTVIKAAYVLIDRLLSQHTSSCHLMTVLAEMDRMEKCDAAHFDKNNQSGISVIVKPLDEEKAFNAFLFYRERPMELFWGWLLRRSIFDEADVPGTVRFLSYFLKKISYLSLPK